MTATLRWALVAGLTIAALALLGRATSILLLAFAAVLIATFLRGCAQWVSFRGRLAYPWALALFIALLVAGAAGLGWLFADQFASQANHLAQELPRAVDRLRDQVSDNAWVQRLASELPNPEQLISSGALARITGIFSTVLGAITGALIVLVMALFLAVDPALYQRGSLRLIPIERRDQILGTMNAIGDVLWRWMLAKFVSMAAIGVLTYIGLLVIGLPLALTLAAIAGLMAFIPNFGPILSSLPAILIGLAEGPSKALQVAAVFLAVQGIESNVLMPVIERRMVRLPPALTITVQVLLGLIAGGLGVLVASPLCAAGMVAVERLYVRDTLGDDMKEETLPAALRAPDSGRSGESKGGARTRVAHFLGKARR
jgi:predicted PurR-regulated permease PerM